MSAASPFTRSIAAFGSAPYPTRSPRTSTRSHFPSACSSAVSNASRLAWMSDRIRKRISGELQHIEDAFGDLVRGRGSVHAEVRLRVGRLPQREQPLHLRSVRG